MLAFLITEQVEAQQTAAQETAKQIQVAGVALVQEQTTSIPLTHPAQADQAMSW